MLSQNWPSLEYFIFDGGSTDSTIDILLKYGDRVHWDSQKDQGQADAVNKGLEASTGDIIAWLNSRDVYYPGAFERVIGYFSEHPDVDVVYGMADHIDENDKPFEPYPTEPWDFVRLKWTCFLCQPAVFFRRSVVKRHGLLDVNLKYCMDYEYWLRLGAAGVRFGYLEAKLAGSRMHPNNKTLGQRVQAHQEIIEMFRQRFGYTSKRWLSNYTNVVNEERLRHIELHKQQVAELQAELQAALITEQQRVEKLQIELHAITHSTIWRLTEPIRLFGKKHPQLTRLARRIFKILWWALTLQLVSRLRPHIRKMFDTKLSTAAGSYRWRLLRDNHTGAHDVDLDELHDLRHEVDQSRSGENQGTCGLTFAISRLNGNPDSVGAIESNPGNRKLISISHVIPWPPLGDDEYFLQRMLTWASSTGWDVILLVAPLAGGEPSDETTTGLAAIYPNLVIVLRDGRVLYRLSEGGPTLENLDGKVIARPTDRLVELEEIDGRLNVEDSLAHDGLVAVLLALNQTLKPAAVFADDILMASLLDALPGNVLKLVRANDTFSAPKEGVERFGALDEPSVTRDEERHLLLNSDVIVANYYADDSILSDIAPAKVVRTSISCDFRPPVSNPIGNKILLIGTDAPSHRKGATDFLRFAWPVVKRAVPTAELLIVGSFCRSIETSDNDIKRIDKVSDLDTLYAQAKVVINPDIAGTDLKVRFLETIAHLRPIVAWPASIEGVDPALKPLCYTASNWYNFATTVVAVLKDASSVNRIEMQRDFIARLVSSDHVYAELGAALDSPEIQ